MKITRNTDFGDFAITVATVPNGGVLKFKFALVNGVRREAAFGLAGVCEGCGQTMIARCGPIRNRHWAHRERCSVDHWRESETDWHRDWKNQFPDDWQEVCLHALNGELHRADVRTDQGYVLEFQHSAITNQEQTSRESFHEKLIWVVDATVRIRDKPKFEQFLERAGAVFDNLPIMKMSGSLEECALLRDWSTSRKPVIFDFGSQSDLWFLLPASTITIAYVVKINREFFLKMHREGAYMQKELNIWFNHLNRLILGNLQSKPTYLRIMLPPRRYPRRRFRF